MWLIVQPSTGGEGKRLNFRSWLELLSLTGDSSSLFKSKSQVFQGQGSSSGFQSPPVAVLFNPLHEHHGYIMRATQHKNTKTLKMGQIMNYKLNQFWTSSGLFGPALACLWPTCQVWVGIWAKESFTIWEVSYGWSWRINIHYYTALLNTLFWLVADGIAMSNRSYSSAVLITEVRWI